MLPRARSSRSWLPLWLAAGVIGWLGLGWIALRLAGLEPPRLGDDLRLLVDAGARWQDGLPLYTTVPPGTPLEAESLFYSYPPIVAQALAPFSSLPFIAIFLAWTAGAVLGLWAVARLLGRNGRALAGRTLALAPFTYPLAVALLMGNVNAWFPAAIGLVLVAILGARRGGTPAAGSTLAAGGTLAAGAALAVATAAKIHPVSLGLWLLVRGIREGRSGASWRILAAAAIAGLCLLAASLAIGGIAPWEAYLDFLRGSAGAADIVSPLNVGPASQLALLLGLSDEVARSVHVVVAIVALGGTAAAARWIQDPVESFGWATAASLVVLPVTWFHYPVLLIPIAVAAASRARGPAAGRTGLILAGALVVAAAAIVAPVVVWVSAALVLAAARVSRGAAAPEAGAPDAAAFPGALPAAHPEAPEAP